MYVFEGYRDALETFLAQNSERFYVYELCRPNGEVFYVGKGINRRVIEHELEAIRHHPIGESNPFKCNVIRQVLKRGGRIKYRIDHLYESTDEQACLKREAELIAYYGRRHEGGSLTNLACGMGSTSGPSPYSIAKHAATLSGKPEHNPERATLNSFLQGIGSVASVPIKPVNQMARILPTTPHPNPRRPTARCAAALIASASAHGVRIEPGARIPRTFTYQGVDGIIENGVARDLLKSGMANLLTADDPREEVFLLDAAQCELIKAIHGRERLNDIGLT